MCNAPAARLVGVPGPGERVCPYCDGNGQLPQRVPQSCAAPWGYPICDACDGTGVGPAMRCCAHAHIDLHPLIHPRSTNAPSS